MSRFRFRILELRDTAPQEWLSAWADRYQEYDEKEYWDLIGKYEALSAEDFVRIGKWKDGAKTKRQLTSRQIACACIVAALVFSVRSAIAGVYCLDHGKRVVGSKCDDIIMTYVQDYNAKSKIAVASWEDFFSHSCCPQKSPTDESINDLVTANAYMAASCALVGDLSDRAASDPAYRSTLIWMTYGCQTSAPSWLDQLQIDLRPLGSQKRKAAMAQLSSEMIRLMKDAHRVIKGG
jgi:hypothetical protein